MSLRIDHAQDGARLRGVIGDGEIVLGPQRNAGGQAHQRVAVSGIKTDAVFQDFLDDEADVLRGHGRAAAKHAANAGFPKIDFLPQGLQQFGRGEKAR